MRLLLSSYSFGAGRGSEAGVGWNVAKGLAERGHDVTVVTTSEFHHLNAPVLAQRSLPLRVLEWDCGITDFPKAASYRRWQGRVCKPLRELCSREHFDLVHHITFNQYRYIHDVFCTGLPYVIGPVGGAETVAPRFWKELPWRMRVKEMLRFLAWDALALSWRVWRSAAPSVVIASNPQTRQRLLHVGGLEDVRLLPIVSVAKEEIAASPSQDVDSPYLFSDAGARPEKGAFLLLRIVARLWGRGVCLPVYIASVREKDKPALLAYARELGLPRHALRCLPFMERGELLRLMARASLFISVAFRDSGSMSLLEALAAGIPAVCFRTAGQFWLPEAYGGQVDPHSPSIEEDFVEQVVSRLRGGARDVQWHRERAEWLHREMDWDARVEQLLGIYEELSARIASQ